LSTSPKTEQVPLLQQETNTKHI